jgi:phosphoribosylglycinamide formyltransferase 1
VASSRLAGLLGATIDIAVLASGSGTNLQALIDASRADEAFGARIAVVVADVEGAGALERARRADIPAEVVAWEGDRVVFTKRVCDVVESYGAGIMVLAGFMRILDRVAVERFPDRILNIHPSLLPAFPGAHAVQGALDHGVEVTGVTVHFVDEQVDHGPIIRQEPVRVLPGDSVEALHDRIRDTEHRLYPEVVKAVAAGRVTVSAGRVIRS